MDQDLNWLEEVKEDAFFITKQRIEADLRKLNRDKKASRADAAQEAEIVESKPAPKVGKPTKSGDE